MKAALYLRVSTEEQADNYSIPSQQERLEAYCKSQDWEVVGSYIDDGYSGKNLNRPEIQRLLKDAHDRLFDVVAVFRLDRFSRRAVDCLRVVEEIFDPNKVWLKSATEPIDTSTPAGRMILSMLVTFAQFERESIAQRVKVNMTHKAKGGEWCGANAAPYGYYNQDKQLFIDEKEAAVVRQMFDLYASGAGLRSIASILNNKGIRTRKGFMWQHSKLSFLLRNPEYAGYMVWNRTERKGTRSISRKREEWIVVEGKHEAIVNRELFERVQRLIGSKKSTGARDSPNYALSGLVYCGVCGSKYRGWYKTTHNGRKVYYYRCGAYYYHDQRHCVSPSVRVDKLESIVIDELEKLEFDKDGCMEAIKYVAATKETESKNITQDINRLTSDYGRIEDRKKRVFDAYEVGAILLSDLQERIEQLNKEKVAIYGRLNELSSSLSDLSLQEAEIENKLNNLVNIRAKWENSSILERQMLARSIIKRVLIVGSNKFELEVF